MICIWYHIWYHSFCYNIIRARRAKNTIIYDIICKIAWFGIWLAYDIINLWHHSFYDIMDMSSYVILHPISSWICDIASYIMAPAARRDGADWGRQTPGAPPAPATPSPTCWGRVFSWTVTALIPRVDLLPISWHLRGGRGLRVRVWRRLTELLSLRLGLQVSSSLAPCKLECPSHIQSLQLFQSY